MLTASGKFSETLQNIVKGLQNAGFSKNDYRGLDKMPEEAKAAIPNPVDNFLIPERQEAVAAGIDEIDPDKINFNPNEVPADTYQPVADIERLAKETNTAFEQQVQVQANDPNFSLFSEIPDKVKKYKMRDGVTQQAKAIRLPQFCIDTPKDELQFFDETDKLLEQGELLDDFKLSNQNSEINFESIKSDLFKLDIKEVRNGEFIPKYILIEDSVVKEPLVEYILTKPRENQIKDIAKVMVELIVDIYPLKDQDIRRYVERIISDMNSEQLQDFLTRKYTYSFNLKVKMRQLADGYAEKKFKEMLLAGKIKMQFNFALQEYIVPGKLGSDIANALYEREGDMNNFEAKVIAEIASLPNMAFLAPESWTW